MLKLDWLTWPALTLVVALLAIAPAPALAQMQVVSVDPLQNSIAPRGSSISVTFDRPVNPATITSSSLRVFGKGSGKASGTFAFSNGNQTVTFDPTTPFAAGETVIVNLANTILAADATPLRSSGFAFDFRAAAGAGGLQFQQVDILTNRDTPTGRTRIYGANASDLNNDGYADLTTVNEISSDIRVFLNKADGSGTFFDYLAPQSIGSLASPNESADFNNDGNIDLCIAASGPNTVSVLLGAGDGTFTIQNVTVGTTPHGIAVLDVDGDSDLDIATANVDSDDLALMLNDGSGTFGAASFFEGGVGGEYGLAAADMNRDGITDLVVAGRNNQTLNTMLGNGNGTFTAAASTQNTGGQTWVVVVGDLDGDRNIDATCANAWSFNASYLMGNGDGTFGAATTTSLSNHVVSTDLGDLDGDGDLDWVVSSFGAGLWRVFTNNGSGVFTFNQDFTANANPSCAIVYDADNDGDLDFALTDEIADEIILQEQTGSPAGIGNQVQPSKLAVRPNFPNPFRAATTISFRLPEAGTARVSVFDVTGALVWKRDVPAAGGWQSLSYPGVDEVGLPVPSGLYFYRVEQGPHVQTGKLTLSR